MLTNDNSGFKLDAGQSHSIQVPDSISSLRFWGRTGCKTNSAGHFVCDTGDCGALSNGYGIQCQGIGNQPASLAEMTLVAGGTDFYDLSNVDGYNLAISIAPYDGSPVNNPDLGRYNCGAISCTMNTAICPPELQKTDSSGNTMCLSICHAVHDVDQRSKFPILKKYFDDVNTRALVCCDCDCGPECGCGNSACKYGCSPLSSESLGKCHVENWPLPSTTQYSNRYDRVFKNQCEDVYSWQFDDMTSTYQCADANYQITFCPSAPRKI